MIDSLLIEDLANAPVQAWATLIERASIVHALASCARLSVVEVCDAAAHLNLKCRRVYRLITDRRQRLAGASPRCPMTGFSSTIEEEQERVIVDALQGTQPGARLRDVQIEVLRLAGERGISPPTERAIRTRFGRSTFAVDLPKRFQIDSDVIVDLCGLDLNVHEGEDAPAAASLLCVIETSTARVVGHQLLGRRLDPDHLANLIRQKLPPSSAPLSLTLSHSVDVVAQSTNELLDREAARFTVQARRIPSGAGIRAALGSRVGRIPIRSRLARHELAPSDPVQLHMARAVIAHLLTQFSSKGVQSEALPA